MRVAADDEVDGLVELADDGDDGSGNPRTLVVVAGREAALVDQHDDGLDAALPELRHQRVDRLGLVPEFQPGDA